MSALFISDLHLEVERADITRSFEHFLKEGLHAGDTLYILGDLFNVWLGDDHQNNFNDRIMAALLACPAKCYLMHGNRDFLLGEAFCAQSGCELLSDPSIVEIGGEKILLMHGDSLCTRDEAYITARKQLRTAEFRKAFLSRNIEDRQAFANHARSESQSHTSTANMEIMDVTPEEVEKVMAAQQVQTLIHGHTHRPALHHLTVAGRKARRLVLGDWRPHCQYARLDASSGLQLLKWP